MNFKSSFYLLLFWVISPFSTYSQEAYSSSPETGILSFTTTNIDIDNQEAKGTPYLNESFVYGEVMVNDKVQLTAKMRFNAYRNEVEVLDNKSDSYYSLFKRSYIKVKIGDKPYSIYPYKDNRGSLRTSYFERLNEGRMVLLFKPESKLKKGKIASTSYDRSSPPTYIWANSYYILEKSDSTDNDVAKKIKLTKKNILSFLNGHDDKINTFIKSQGLKLKKDKEVVKLLNYYNTL